jgi:hypothetical protein
LFEFKFDKCQEFIKINKIIWRHFVMLPKNVAAFLASKVLPTTT